MALNCRFAVDRASPAGSEIRAIEAESYRREEVRERSGPRAQYCRRTSNGWWPAKWGADGATLAMSIV